jgi:hypothetical protein
MRRIRDPVKNPDVSLVLVLSLIRCLRDVCFPPIRLRRDELCLSDALMREGCPVLLEESMRLRRDDPVVCRDGRPMVSIRLDSSMLDTWDME